MGCSNRPGFSEDAVPDSRTNRDRVRTAGGGVIFPERTSPQRTIRNQVVVTPSGYAILAPKNSPAPMDRYRVFQREQGRRKDESIGALSQVSVTLGFYLLSPLPTDLYPVPLENPLKGFQVDSSSFFQSLPVPLNPVPDLVAGIADANILGGEYIGRFFILNEFLPYLRFQRDLFTVAISFTDEENQRVFPGYTASVTTNLGSVTQSIDPAEVGDVDLVPPISVPLGGTSVNFYPTGFTLADAPPSANTTFSSIEITIRGL